MHRMTFHTISSIHVAAPGGMRNRDEAVRFLRNAANYPEVLADLRLWAVGSRATGRSDRDLLDRVATALVSGWLAPRFASRRIAASVTGRVRTAPATGGRSAVEDSKTPRRAPRSAPTPAPVAAPPVDDHSVPTDPAGQVAALLAAAEAGTPFCEQCERARQARA